MSLSHDPLGSSRRVTRTPPSTGRKSNDDTVQSIETIRRAPLNRLSDRLSFGAEDVDDTMMEILANRADPSGGGFADESLDFGAPPIDEYSPPLKHADESDDTMDLRGPVDDVEGEFTTALNRVSPDPEMTLDNIPIKSRKPNLPRPQKYPPSP